MYNISDLQERWLFKQL